MHDHLKTNPEIQTNQLVAVRQERRQLLKTFWLGVMVLFLVELYTVQTSSIVSIFSAVLIAFAALLPVYLWCSGKALGIPIFPIFTLTYLWTHALPLVGNNPKILAYSPEQHLFASFTVAGFLLLGTLIWFLFVRRPGAIPKSYQVLKGQNSDGLFFFILTAGIFFNMSTLGGWFELFDVSFALISGTILLLNFLFIFILLYRWDSSKLSTTKSKIISLSLLVFYIITIVASFSIFSNIQSFEGKSSVGGGGFALIRGAVLGLNVISIFVLSYRCGTKELSKTKSTIFLNLLASYIITNAASLLLISALSTVLLAAIAFILGRRKIPWLPIILVLICLSFLHYGKGEMRVKYWGGSNQEHFIQPWEYPAWYGEWTGYSFEYFHNLDFQRKSEEQASFLQRSTVIHMLLMAQSKTPDEVPYLLGETYNIIPQLLMPRILNQNKIRSHEGTYLLNIHYGLQNRAATFNTTIGWGLLSEAYANFGLLGCGGLAIILGTAYGQATRWSLNTSLLSFRSLCNVLLMGFAFQTEWSAGVYAAALFQSFIVLGAITFVFMKAQKREIMFVPYIWGNSEVRSQNNS